MVEVARLASSIPFRWRIQKYTEEYTHFGEGGETHEFRVRRAGSAILDFTVVDAGFPVDERSISKFLSKFPVTPRPP